MKLKFAIVAVLVTCLAGITGCGRDDPEDQSAAVVETVAPAHRLIQTTVGDRTYDPSEILGLLSQQVVRVETPSGAGSGILLDSGHIVTVAAVVWPFEQARLRFMDGTVIENVPVVASDLLLGVSVVGPLNVDFDLRPFLSGEVIEVGDPASIVGFGIGSEDPNILGIAEGEVSHWQFWEPGGLAFFHTTPNVLPYDLDEVESISGTVVSKSGQVTGMFRSTYQGFEDDFVYSNLVIPADDVLRIADKLIGDPNSNDLAGRGLDWSRGSSELELQFSPLHSSEVFLIEANVGANVEITASGSGDGQIAVIRSDFTEMALEEYGSESGAATVNFDVANSMAHYLFVGNWSEETLSSTVHSTAPLIPFTDPDDGPITKAISMTGFSDYYFDSDVFEIQLKAGDSIVAVAESIDYFDMWFARKLGSDRYEEVDFEDHWHSLDFTHAQINFTASQTSTYVIVVSGLVDIGYEVTVYDSGEQPEFDWHEEF